MAYYCSQALLSCTFDVLQLSYEYTDTQSNMTKKIDSLALCVFAQLLETRSCPFRQGTCAPGCDGRTSPLSKRRLLSRFCWRALISGNIYRITRWSARG